MIKVPQEFCRMAFSLTLFKRQMILVFLHPICVIMLFASTQDHNLFAGSGFFLPHSRPLPPFQTSCLFVFFLSLQGMQSNLRNPCSAFGATIVTWFHEISMDARNSYRHQSRIPHWNVWSINGRVHEYNYRLFIGLAYQQMEGMKTITCNRRREGRKHELHEAMMSRIGGIYK